MTTADLGFERKVAGYVYGESDDDNSESEAYQLAKEREEEECQEFIDNYNEEKAEYAKYNDAFELWHFWKNIMRRTNVLTNVVVDDIVNSDLINMAFMEYYMASSQKGINELKYNVESHPNKVIDMIRPYIN